jgi:hypothetical protein
MDREYINLFHVQQFHNETHLKMENKRKKWTPKETLTSADIKFNEKRKWQLALRRYVIEQKPNYQYAPYFGLDIINFRNWIELQFTAGLNWDNFGTNWQFDHIIPVNYFDFELEEDLKLCWNFINLQVENLDKSAEDNTKVDIFSAKAHFEKLYKTTNYKPCGNMIVKIEQLEQVGVIQIDAKSTFITEHKQHVDALQTLAAEEFARINAGEKLSDILLEQEMMKKFG